MQMPHGPTRVRRHRKGVAEEPRRVRRAIAHCGELGRGTFGEVWLAEDEETGVKVAIKFLNIALSHQWQALQAEVKQLATFQEDPGIVQLKHFDAHAPRPYYVMAYAEGGSLAQRLKEGPLPVAKALPMFRRIAEAMAYVHARGIRHCDLKPANILLDSRERPRVADFGQAHLASDMTPALGTFFYMAPEQADLAGTVPGTRWDVYGLGALLYAMLTGKPPHEDSTLREDLEKTEKLSHRLKIYRDAMARAKPLKAHREIPGVDSQLAYIIERRLSIDPTKRYASAEAVVAALNHRDRKRRQRPILVAGLVVPLLLLGTLGLLGWWKATSVLATSRANLEKEAMKSYSVSAKLAADQVKRNLEYFVEKLTLAARDEKLVAGMTDVKASQKELQSRLEEFMRDTSRSGKVRGLIYYCLFDSKGTLVGRCPVDDDEYLLDLTHNFSWRGYFHGGRDDWEAAKLTSGPQVLRPTFRPLSETLVSHPFKGYDSKASLLVGVSTPIKRNSNIVGVLLATLDLSALNEWLEEIPMEDDGFPVLIDNELHMLMHKNRTYRNIEKGKNPEKHEQCDEYRAVFDRKTGGSTILVDPLMKEEYLAAYTPIDFVDATTNTRIRGRWGVLVQVKHAKVIEPATMLQSELSRWARPCLSLRCS